MTHMMSHLLRYINFYAELNHFFAVLFLFDKRNFFLGTMFETYSGHYVIRSIDK